jgi:hypothetical protein
MTESGQFRGVDCSQFAFQKGVPAYSLSFIKRQHQSARPTAMRDHHAPSGLPHAREGQIGWLRIHPGIPDKNFRFTQPYRSVGLLLALQRGKAHTRQVELHRPLPFESALPTGPSVTNPIAIPINANGVGLNSPGYPDQPPRQYVLCRGGWSGYPGSGSQISLYPERVSQWPRI